MREPKLRTAAMAVAGAMRVPQDEIDNKIMGTAPRSTNRQFDAPPTQAAGPIVDKISEIDELVAAPARQPKRRRIMTTQADRITALIAQCPGIRNIEIAEELDIDVDLVRPCLQGRIENSQIIVDKVQSVNGALINAYRVNPKWTPADAKFKPVKAKQSDDAEPWPGGPGRRVAAAPKAKKPKPAKRLSAGKQPPFGQRPADIGTSLPAPFWPGTTANDKGPDLRVDPGQRLDVAATPPVVSVAPADCNFTCAVHHDGRAEIHAAGRIIILTPDQAIIVARHLALVASIPMAVDHETKGATPL